MDFKREIVIKPAFDKRDTDPKNNYGIHCCEMVFYLIKDGKAVQFVIYTDFHLKHVREEMKEKSHWDSMGADVGYHYDGSTLSGNDMFDLLCEKGSEAVWEKLERFWESQFNESKEE